MQGRPHRHPPPPCVAGQPAAAPQRPLCAKEGGGRVCGGGGRGRGWGVNAAFGHQAGRTQTSRMMRPSPQQVHACAGACCCLPDKQPPVHAHAPMQQQPGRSAPQLDAHLLQASAARCVPHRLELCAWWQEGPFPATKGERGRRKNWWWSWGRVCMCDGRGSGRELEGGGRASRDGGGGRDGTLEVGGGRAWGAGWRSGWGVERGQQRGTDTRSSAVWPFAGPTCHAQVPSPPPPHSPTRPPADTHRHTTRMHGMSSTQHTARGGHTHLHPQPLPLRAPTHPRARPPAHPP